MRKTILASCLVLLSGCAAGVADERWVFEKSGASEAELKRDRSECFAASVGVSDMERGGLVRVDRKAYRACMEQRGYTLRVQQ
jgi:hypothetical protein